MLSGGFQDWLQWRDNIVVLAAAITVTTYSVSIHDGYRFAWAQTTICEIWTLLRTDTETVEIYWNFFWLSTYQIGCEESQVSLRESFIRIGCVSKFCETLSSFHVHSP